MSAKSRPGDSATVSARVTRLNRAAAGLCLAAAAVAMAVCAFKYYHFGYTDWDLAIYTQAMGQLLRGHAYEPLAGLNFFGDHAVFIMLALLPLFAAVPHALTLVFVKVAAYAFSGWLLYGIAARRTGEVTALVLLFIYLIFPPNIFAVLYEFNAESLSPVFILLLYMFFERGQWRRFMVTLLLTLTVKENMCLIGAGFGVLGLLLKRGDRWRWGALPLAVSAAVFLLLVGVVIPGLRGTASHAFVARYPQFGSTVGEVAASVLTKPGMVWTMLADPRNLDYLVFLFGPLLIPAVLSPHWLIPALPLLLQHLLSNNPNEHTVYQHYNSSLVPFLFLATISTLGWLRRYLRVREAAVMRFFFFILVGMLVVFSGVALFQFKPQMSGRIMANAGDRTPRAWRLVKMMDRDDGVVATFDYLAALAPRDHLYSFHKIYMPEFQDPALFHKNTFAASSAFTLPPEATHALIDFEERYLSREAERALLRPARPTIGWIRDFYESSDWRVRGAAGSLVLLQRGIGEGPKLIERRMSGPEAPESSGVNVDGRLRLRVTPDGGVTGDAVGGLMTVPLTFEWQALDNIDAVYAVQVLLKRQETTLDFSYFVIGYMIYPTLSWRAGDVIRERRWMLFPRAEPGAYTLKIYVLRMTDEGAETVGMSGDGVGRGPEGDFLTTTLIVANQGD